MRKLSFQVATKGIVAVLSTTVLCTACGQTQEQIASEFACAADSTGAIVSITNTVKAPTLTTAQKTLTTVGTLVDLGANDPACQKAIAVLVATKPTVATVVK